MIDVRVIEDLLNAEMRVASLVSAYEHDEVSFADAVKLWLAEVEQKMIASRFPFASELGVLRGGIVAAERGVMPADMTFGRHATPRKVRSAVAFNALRKGEEILRTAIKPLAMQIAEGEQLVRSLLALAEQKGVIVFGDGGTPPDPADTWKRIEEHADLRNAAAHALATLGRTNVLILLQRALVLRLT